MLRKMMSQLDMSNDINRCTKQTKLEKPNSINISEYAQFDKCRIQLTGSNHKTSNNSEGSNDVTPRRISGWRRIEKLWWSTCRKGKEIGSPSRVGMRSWR